MYSLVERLSTLTKNGATQATKPQPTLLKDSAPMHHEDGAAGFSRLLMCNKIDLMRLLSRLPTKTVPRRLTLASVNSNIKHIKELQIMAKKYATCEDTFQH